MTETLTNPLDRFFRQSLARQDVATDFLRHYLPPEAAALANLESVQAMADTFVDEELQAHYSDLLFTVRLNDNRPAVVYVLFEHKSYPDVRVAFHLMEKLSQIERTAEFVATVLRYLITGSSTITEADLRESMEEHWPEGVSIMATIADNWVRQGIQQGMQQGLQQGMQQGLLEGRRQGLLDAISLGVKLKFGKEGLRLLAEIRRIEDLATLETIYDSILVAENPDDLRRLYAEPQV